MTAESGAGHATIRWEPVAEAVGYLVHRAPSPDGPWKPVDHGGRDVLAMPGPACCDTTGTPGEGCFYAVASLPSIESEPGELSEPVEAEPSAEPAAALSAVVRPDTPAGRLHPVWHLVGSEHVSQLLYEETTGGQPIGGDFAQALELARHELGVTRVRAHAILHDELGIVRDGDFDFTGIGRVYDRLLELGMRPLVEVSFMPRDLARDPEETVFEYRGVISPPSDWDAWAELNRQLAEYLVERYGIDEVAGWGFEIWNEPNLEVFWSGTQEEYFRLYDTAARAIKSVDERLLVGGPSTAAAGWVVDFLDFVVAEGSPFDFFTTHTYGNLPLDVRRALSARGLDDAKVWWTEWGATPTHFNEVTDAAWSAPFVLHGMKSLQGRADALAYWVVSDHFEELGRPPRLLHGGFGLLTVGNLRKPRWYALLLAEQLGPNLVELELAGDGAGGLVDGWAAVRDDGSVDVLLWNGTLDQSKVSGDALLDRRVVVRVVGRSGPASVARIDAEHSNTFRDWDDSKDWPSEEEWRRLREADRLDEEEIAFDGEVELELPMPGVLRLRVAPE